MAGAHDARVHGTGQLHARHQHQAVCRGDAAGGGSGRALPACLWGLACLPRLGSAGSARPVMPVRLLRPCRCCPSLRRSARCSCSRGTSLLSRQVRLGGRRRCRAAPADVGCHHLRRLLTRQAALAHSCSGCCRSAPCPRRRPADRDDCGGAGQVGQPGSDRGGGQGGARAWRAAAGPLGTCCRVMAAAPAMRRCACDVFTVSLHYSLLLCCRTARSPRRTAPRATCTACSTPSTSSPPSLRTWPRA